MCNAYTESGKPCHFDGCESYKLAQAALAAAQLRYGDLDMETARIRSDRDRLAGQNRGYADGNDIIKKTLEAMELQQESLVSENEKYRAALAPLLAHAEADDYAPPLKFSVDACREIRRTVDG